MWAPQWVSDDIGGLPVLVGMAGPDDVAGAEAQPQEARRRPGRRPPADPRARPADEAQRRRLRHRHQAARRSTSPRRTGSTSAALVRDLSATLQGRVELRQLSARDEARLTGGIGSCGRELCCSTFLVDFEPVSVRMAKDQDLPLNPLRISGACGRLMCCLKYEHPLYQDFAERGARARRARSRPRTATARSSGTTSRASRSSCGWPPTAGGARARSPPCAPRARLTTTGPKPSAGRWMETSHDRARHCLAGRHAVLDRPDDH